MKKLIPIFLLLIAHYFIPPEAAHAQSLAIQTGKSYVNVTKGLNGGTIEAGDILEIRATIAVGDFSTNPIITNVRFNDTIPTGTTYVANSMRILTNEGLAWRSFTDASTTDQAVRNGNFIRINMGSSYNGGNAGSVNYGAAPPATAVPTGTTGGSIRYNGRPSFYGGVCIMSASYRIQVNAGLPYGTSISMYGGAFRYDSTSARIRPLPAYTIVLTQNLGLCTNSIGANAIIDNGGTFGSGTTQVRSTSAIVPGYIFRSVVTDGQPNDGSYSIVNNMSPTGSTNVNSPKPDANTVATNIARVFRLWDIMGDHTGATVPANGNLPVAPGTNGGYFVAINASYANNNAIQQTVGGLCPNTYYEFSAWFKNICEYCACDSTGDAPFRQSGSSWVANGNFNGPDQSGVNPNLTFTIDGIDLYTTGNLAYNGQWVKKGFIYRTGPLQEGFTLTIRNNAAGGGGNDWGIDDVTLATCTPNLNLQPSPSMAVCFGNTVDMFAEVRSFFPNYNNWRWERSINGGTTWTNTGISGVGTPVMVSGEYQYTATYPTFLSDSSTHNNLYRIRIATTPQNLDNPNCSFVATTTITVMVNNCSEVLKSDILSFTGSVADNQGHLKWTITDEAPNTYYEIESSTNGTDFEKIGSVQAAPAGGSIASYQYTDSRALNGARYYRIKVTDGQVSKYSRIVLLSTETLAFALKTIANPFNNSITLELVSPGDGPIMLSLLDMYGRTVKQSKETAQRGMNTFHLSSLGGLPAGVYLLQVQSKEATVSRRLLKANQ